MVRMLKLGEAAEEMDDTNGEAKNGAWTEGIRAQVMKLRPTLGDRGFEEQGRLCWR